jgi:hypothetical protein
MSGLFGSTILEVVLGLSFVYLLLSLVCSSINELLAGFLKLRAKDLDTAIRNLLRDPGLATEVLGHPLIRALGSTGAETIAVQVAAGRNPVQQLWRWVRGLWGHVSRYWRDYRGKPSYVPARTFTVALFDAITPPDRQAINVGDIQRAAEERARAVTDEGKPDEAKQAIGKALLSLINDSRDPAQLFLSLDDAKVMVDRLTDPTRDNEVRQAVTAAGTFEELRRHVERIGDDDVRKRLLAAIAEGQAGFDRARRSIERWFDDAMDRTSGIYKRRTQWWLLVIAAFVTLLMGADTFRLYDSLATNPGLRAALVAQSEQATAPGSDFVPPTPPVDADATGTPTADEAADSPPAPSVGEVFDELEQTSLPFGYSDRPGLNGEQADAGDWFRWLVRKIPGLLVTTFAVALGAPFWFDVLNKVSNIRAAGKPPAPTNSAAQPPSRPSQPE